MDNRLEKNDLLQFKTDISSDFILAKMINSYLPSFFVEDNDLKENFTSIDIRDAAIIEIKNILRYEKKEFNAKNFYFEGYQEFLDSNKIEVYFTDKTNDAEFTIVFKKYQTSRQKVINALKQKLSKAKFATEDNSKQQFSAEPYAREVALKDKTVFAEENPIIIIGAENIEVSYKRMIYRSYTTPKPEDKTVSIYFNLYKNDKDQNEFAKAKSNSLTMKIKLKNRKKDEKEEEKDNEKTAEKVGTAIGVTLAAGLGAGLLSLLGDGLSDLFGFLGSLFGSSASSAAGEMGENITKNEFTDSLSEALKEETKNSIKAKTKDALRKELTKKAKKLEELLDEELNLPDVPDTELELPPEFNESVEEPIAESVGNSSRTRIAERVKDWGNNISDSIGDQLEEFSNETDMESNMDLDEAGYNSEASEVDQTLENEGEAIQEDVNANSDDTLNETETEISDEMTDDSNLEENTDDVIKNIKDRLNDLLQELVDKLKRELLNNIDQGLPQLLTPKARTNLFYVMSSPIYTSTDDDFIDQETKDQIIKSLVEAYASDTLDEVINEELGKFLNDLILKKLKPNFDNFMKTKIKKLVHDYLLKSEFKTKILNELKKQHNQIFKEKFKIQKAIYRTKIMEKKVNFRLSKAIKNNETQWYTLLKNLSGPFDVVQKKVYFLNELELDKNFIIETKETTKVTKKLENILSNYLKLTLNNLDFLLKDYESYQENSEQIKKWITEKLSNETKNQISIMGELVPLSILDFDVTTKKIKDSNNLEITLIHPRLLQPIVSIITLK